MGPVNPPTRATVDARERAEGVLPCDDGLATIPYSKLDACIVRATTASANRTALALQATRPAMDPLHGHDRAPESITLFAVREVPATLARSRAWGATCTEHQQRCGLLGRPRPLAVAHEQTATPGTSSLLVSTSRWRCAGRFAGARRASCLPRFASRRRFWICRLTPLGVHAAPRTRPVARPRRARIRSAPASRSRAGDLAR